MASRLATFLLGSFGASGSSSSPAQGQQCQPQQNTSYFFSSHWSCRRCLRRSRFSQPNAGRKALRSPGSQASISSAEPTSKVQGRSGNAWRKLSKALCDCNMHYPALLRKSARAGVDGCSAHSSRIAVSSAVQSGLAVNTFTSAHLFSGLVKLNTNVMARAKTRSNHGSGGRIRHVSDTFTHPFFVMHRIWHIPLFGRGLSVLDGARQQALSVMYRQARHRGPAQTL
jgi:hypothetical protein